MDTLTRVKEEEDLCDDVLNCASPYAFTIKEEPLFDVDNFVAVNQKRKDENKNFSFDKKLLGCRESGKKFGKPSDLKRRMRFDSVEKPHRCSECGKKFG